MIFTTILPKDIWSTFGLLPNPWKWDIFKGADAGAYSKDSLPRYSLST